DAIMKNVGAFKKAIRNVMKHLEMLDGEAQYAEEWGILKGTNVRCTYGGLMIPTEKCRIKQEVKKGDHLVTIVDLFGEELDRIRAPQDGMVLGVPVLPLAYPGNNILTIAKVTETIR
ncbi:MAG: succinylglutamate desuccinylase/aspartoacylase family protein, partial [Promethearchaeati archaeon]